MSRRISLLFLVLALILAACQSASPTAGPPTDTAAPTETSPPPTQAEAASSGDGAACTVVSLLPTPGPTEQSLFPPVSEADWVKGPDSAHVTLIEYGDFQ